MTLDVALCCIAQVLTLVAMQHDTRIDSDSILAFPALRPCVWLQKKIGLELIIFACPKLDATQRDVLRHVVDPFRNQTSFSSLSACMHERVKFQPNCAYHNTMDTRQFPSLRQFRMLFSREGRGGCCLSQGILELCFQMTKQLTSQQGHTSLVCCSSCK